MDTKTISTIVATAFIAATGTWTVSQTIPAPITPQENYTYQKIDDSSWKETYSTCSVRNEVHTVADVKGLIDTYTKRKADVAAGKEPNLENTDLFINKYTNELKAAADVGVGEAQALVTQ